MPGRSDFAELLRRTRLVRVLLVYLGGSFAALEAVDLLGDKMALPEWVFTGAIVLLLLGLPIVIATALIQAGPSDSLPPVAALGHDQRVAPVGPGGGATRERVVGYWSVATRYGRTMPIAAALCSDAGGVRQQG